MHPRIYGPVTTVQMNTWMLDVWIPCERASRNADGLCDTKRTLEREMANPNILYVWAL